MLCPTCNADVPAGAAFCPKCGRQLGAAPPSTAAAPLAAAAPAAPTAMEKFRAALPTGQPQAEPEHELWHGSYSAKAMYGKFVLGILVTLAGIALAILVPPHGWMVAVIVVPILWVALMLNLLVMRL